jgi:IstB-like ATP binding protein
MEIPPDLVRRLKRLRLGGLLPTLPDRATHARQAKLSPLEFLELLLQDEIDRRNSKGLQQRLVTAGFEEEVPPEAITWETPVSYDRPRVRELFGLHWLAQQENVIFTGPVGVGKSYFAQALGHTACRAGHAVRYIKAAQLLHALHASRADNSFERELRGWLAWDLLIVDDFGLSEAHGPAVQRPLRRPRRTASSGGHGHHEQPRRRGMGGPLRRPHPGQQRPGPFRSPGPSDRDGGAEPPRAPHPSVPQGPPPR